MQNSITNVGFGGPYASEQASIQRRQKLAQLLQQQAMQPVDQQATPAGGFTPRTSPLQGLARVMQGYTGMQKEKEADAKMMSLSERMQQDRQQALAQALAQGQGSPQPAPEMGGGPAMPPNPMGAAQTLAGANDPALQQAGMGMIGKQMEAQMPQRPPNPQEMAFKERESALGRESRESMAAQASADRASQAEIARQDRIAAQQRQQDFIRSERGGRESFQTQQADENRKFREMMMKATKEGKPLSEFQGRNVLFGARMADSDKTLNELEDKISTTGLATKQAASNVPLIGGMLGAVGNVALSKEQQRVEQAQRNFVNAVLRQESGAVINPSEFVNAQKQYFPQPGDTKEVITQKKQNRRLAINAFKVLAGPGGEQIDSLLAMPQMPGNAPLQQPATQISGGIIDFSALPQDRRGR